MTARLSPLQRQVLEQLAHIRVAPEDAWLTSERLATLTGTAPSRMETSLLRLWRRGLIDYDAVFGAHHTRAWRITNKGREALG